MRIRDLDTPALLIDLDRLEANLDRAAQYAASHGLRIRPHTKTHKSPRIARMQLDRGAAGLTVAKVGEAEVLADVGAPELLLAYPVWGPAKWRRLAEVATRVPVTVALDNRESASGLSSQAGRRGVRFGILVEVDVGMRRCGLRPGEGLVDLARAVSGMPHLRLDGIMFYPGHIQRPDQDGGRDLRRLASQVDRVLHDFQRAGLPTGTVSGGSTPTLFHSHSVGGQTEIRPGTYAFNDRTQVGVGSCGWDDCAATVLATVVSVPSRSRAIIDGGSKTFSSDPCRPGGDGGFGRVVDLPGSRFPRMSEEHGVLDLRGCTAPAPRIGDRLRIVPNHVCVTVNLHEVAYGVRGDRVEDSWPVEGRGKLQ